MERSRALFLVLVLWGTLLASAEPAAACALDDPEGCLEVVGDGLAKLAEEGKKIYEDLSADAQEALADLSHESIALLKQYAGDAWDELVAILETIPEVTEDLTKALADAARQVATAAVDEIQAKAQQAMDQMVKIAETAYTTSVAALEQVAITVADEVTAVAETVAAETWGALTHACTTDWGPVPNVCGAMIDCADAVVDITGGANVAKATGACMESWCSITPAGLAAAKAQEHVWSPPSDLSSVVEPSGLESAKGLNTNTDLCGFVSDCTTNMIDKGAELGTNIVDGAQALYDITPNIRRLSSVLALLDHDAVGQMVDMAEHEAVWGAWDPDGAGAEVLHAVSLERERVELLRAAAQMVVGAEAGDLQSLLYLFAELVPVLDQLEAMPPAGDGIEALRASLGSMYGTARDPAARAAVLRDIQVLDALEQNQELLSARQDDLLAVAKGAKAAHSLVTMKTTMASACFGVDGLAAARELAGKGIDQAQQVPWSQLQHGTGAGRFDQGVEAADAHALPVFPVADHELTTGQFKHETRAHEEVDAVFWDEHRALRKDIEAKLDPAKDYQGSTREQTAWELATSLLADVSFEEADKATDAIPGIIHKHVAEANQELADKDWTPQEKAAFEAKREAARHAVSWAQQQAADLVSIANDAGLDATTFANGCFLGAVANATCHFDTVCTGPGADWGRAQEAFGRVLKEGNATTAQVLQAIRDEQACVRAICDARSHDVRRLSDAFASLAGPDLKEASTRPFMLAGALDAMALQLEAPCDNEVARLQTWHDHLAVAAPAALEAHAAHDLLGPAGTTPVRPAGSQIPPSQGIRQAWLDAGGDEAAWSVFLRDQQAAADAGDVVDLMVRADQGERLPLQDLFGQDLLKPGAGEGLQWMQGMGQALVALRMTGTDLAGGAQRATAASGWLVDWADRGDLEAQTEDRVRAQAEALNTTARWLDEAQAHLDGLAGNETAFAQAWLSRLAAVAPLLGEDAVHPDPLLPWRPASAGAVLADMQVVVASVRDQHVTQAAGLAGTPGAWSPHTYWLPEEPPLVPWEPIHFVVNSTGDEGDAAPDGACRTTTGNCTLRAALEAAMDEDITVRITFGTTARTIHLGSPLPAIVDRSLVLDGEGLDPPVHITGDDQVPVGLDAQADGTTIKGLEWSGFTQQAVRITGDFARVSGNRFHDNGRTGSGIDGGALHLDGSRARVEDNVFENNTGRAGGSIHARGAGHAFTGNHHIGNRADDTGGALHLEHAPRFVSSDETFTGNRAGANGTAVFAAHAPDLVLQQADISGPAGNAGAWNVFLEHANGTLRENRIDGQSDDGLGGILAAGGPFHIVDNSVRGGAGAGLLLQSSVPGSSVHGNTLSGNGQAGLRIQADAVAIANNTLAGNGHGLRIEAPSGDGHTVRDNTIRGNKGAGIIVRGGDGHVLSRNALTGNGDLAIDRAARDEGDGPTRNALHNDTRSRNKPTLLWAAEGQVAVQYQGAPNATVQVEVYRNDACHASGYGPLETYLTTWTLTTNATGMASSILPLPGIGPHQWLAATATTDEGTSEPGPCIEVKARRAVAIEARDHEGLLLQSPHRLDRSGNATRAVDFQAVVNATDLVAFQWDLGDGTVHEEAAAGGPLNTTRLHVRHAWDRPGTYTVSFTARFADGFRAMDTMEVRVVDRTCSGPLAITGAAGLLDMPGLRVDYTALQPSVADACAALGAFPALLDDRPDIHAITGNGRMPLRYASMEPQPGQNGSFEVLLGFTYTDEELDRLRLRESALTVHYWNGTAWHDVRNGSYPHDIPANNGEKDLRVLGFVHDLDADTVQVRVNHTSAFGLVGQTWPRGGGGGGRVAQTPAPAGCEHIDVARPEACTQTDQDLPFPEGFDAAEPSFTMQGDATQVAFGRWGKETVLLRLEDDTWQVHATEVDEQGILLSAGTYAVVRDVAAPTLDLRQEDGRLIAMVRDNVGAAITWSIDGTVVHRGEHFDTTGFAAGTRVVARATDPAGLRSEAAFVVADTRDVGPVADDEPPQAFLPTPRTSPMFYVLMVSLMLAAAAVSVALALTLHRISRR